MEVWRSGPRADPCVDNICSRAYMYVFPRWIGVAVGWVISPTELLFSSLISMDRFQDRRVGSAVAGSLASEVLYSGGGRRSSLELDTAGVSRSLASTRTQKLAM